MMKNLFKLIIFYLQLEDLFLQSINNSRAEGEGRIVALDKLADQKRFRLKDKLFYRLNDEFEIIDDHKKRIYLDKTSGQKVEVTYADIIRYGNEMIWEDFYFESEDKKEVQL
jgi:hypothetical protein